MSAEVLEVIDEVRSACGTAIDVTNDILTYEKIDSNILTLETGPTDIVEVTSGVCSMFQIQAKSAGIELTLDVSALRQKCVVVDGDSSKLAQVFRNLVSNAVKFTPVGGRVTLTLSLNHETKRVRLEVQDTGPGMRKEDRARLFNEVIQFDAKLLQNGQGSGLGLYLSRKVIDMHGGSIGVDLEWEGVGSKFYIELDVSELKDSGRGKAALFYAEGGLLTLLTHRKH
jgi:signal transduction histidine kinase